MHSPVEILYDELNSECFGGKLPRCQIRWSRRLTRAAGNIQVRQGLITLSVPLLVDAWSSEATSAGSPGPPYLVCGVLCADASVALREILKHEMIHYWLHVEGRPSGHTAEFRAKAKALGQPRTRHQIARPQLNFGWAYECPGCRVRVLRQRRMRRIAACAACCKLHGNGKYDGRFRLSGQRLHPSPAP